MTPPEVEAILQWNPQLLKVGAVTGRKAMRDPRSGYSSSVATRAPTSYDKHLPKHLILKRVVTLANLPDKLAALVDRATDAADGSLPPWDGTPTSNRVTDQAKVYATPLVDEASVVDAYRDTIGAMCVPVASTLTFTPRNKGWTECARIVPRADTVAKPDRVLKLFESNLDSFDDPDSSSNEPSCYDDIESAQYRRLAKETAGEFPCVMTLEMKSATVGDRKKMYRISKLVEEREAHGRDFPWTRCPSSATCKKSGRASLRNHESQVEAPSFDPVNTLTNIFGPDGLPPLPQPIFPPRSSPRNHQPLTKQSEVIFSQETEATLARGQDAEDRLDAEDRDADMGVEEPAAHVLQQAWAQAVRCDTTFILINSGNFEFVCYRHRKEQRLYISRCLEYAKYPDCQPPAGKVHVGLYIAALRDAMARMRRRNGPKLADDIDELGGDFSFEKLVQGKPMRKASGDLTDKPSKKAGQAFGPSTIRTLKNEISPAMDTHVDVSGDIFEVAGVTRGTLMAAVSGTEIRPTVATPEGPPTTSRGDPSGHPPTHPASLTIRVDTCVVRGEPHEQVYGGHLRFSNRVGESFPVLLKIAGTEEEKVALKKEQELYEKIGDEGFTGFPTCLGMFTEGEGTKRGKGKAKGVQKGKGKQAASGQDGYTPETDRPPLHMLIFFRKGVLLPNQAPGLEQPETDHRHAFKLLRRQLVLSGITLPQLFAANLVTGTLEQPFLTLLQKIERTPVNTKHSWWDDGGPNSSSQLL